MKRDLWPSVLFSFLFCSLSSHLCLSNYQTQPKSKSPGSRSVRPHEQGKVEAAQEQADSKYSADGPQIACIHTSCLYILGRLCLLGVQVQGLSFYHLSR